MASQTPKVMQAIKVNDNKAKVTSDVPIPKLRPTYLLAKVEAIALNPTDWTTLDAQGAPGTIVGVDYAGIVEEVGSTVSRPFVKGDRIAGLSQGG